MHEQTQERPPTICAAVTKEEKRFWDDTVSRYGVASTSEIAKRILLRAAVNARRNKSFDIPIADDLEHIYREIRRFSASEDKQKEKD